MNKYDVMFERIQKESPSREIQVAVADLVAESLEQVQQSFGYWEKETLSYAIAALAQNLGSGQTITDFWLRLSLVSAEKALAPKEQRNETYGRKDDAVNALTHQQLTTELQQLRARL